MTHQRIAAFAMLLALLLAADGAVSVATAAPTPVPGGANQTSGVTGTMAGTLFNGTLRLKAMSLKVPTPADNMHANAANERPIVFHAIVSNGAHEENHGYFDATLADANGITVTGRPLDDGWSLEQGTAARTSIGFSIPADFVPLKLVLIQAAKAHPKAFRITIAPGDVPVAEATTP